MDGVTDLSSDEENELAKKSGGPQKKQSQIQETPSDDDDNNSSSNSSHESPSSSSEIDSSDSDGSSVSKQSEDGKKQHQPIRKSKANVTVATSGKKRARPSSICSDSCRSREDSSSDSSEESESSGSSSSESSTTSSTSEEDDHESTVNAQQALEEKKRLDRQAAHAAAMAWQPKVSHATTTSSSLKNKNDCNRRASTGGIGRGGQAFRRVEDEKWVQSLNNGVKSNHYEATFGTEGYGYKAHQKLSAKRGKVFRHEKTKKKRGSYRGGKISMEQNGFRFDSD